MRLSLVATGPAYLKREIAFRGLMQCRYEAACSPVMSRKNTSSIGALGIVVSAIFPMTLKEQPPRSEPRRLSPPKDVIEPRE
jgi:hypothetical protein